MKGPNEGKGSGGRVCFWTSPVWGGEAPSYLFRLYASAKGPSLATTFSRWALALEHYTGEVMQLKVEFQH